MSVEPLEISHETIGRNLLLYPILLNTNFLWRMENILNLYEQDYSPLQCSSTLLIKF
jgi:hypothetical protein